MILMCEFEGSPGVYCDRSFFFMNFDGHAHNPVFNSKYNLLYSDGKNDMHKELMEKMGLTKDDLPTLRAFDPKKPYVHYKYDKPHADINLNSLLTFGSEVASGKLTTIKLTEPFMPLQDWNIYLVKD